MAAKKQAVEKKPAAKKASAKAAPVEEAVAPVVEEPQPEPQAPRDYSEKSRAEWAQEAADAATGKFKTASDEEAGHLSHANQSLVSYFVAVYLREDREFNDNTPPPKEG
jgi:hypothetical protein